MEDNTHTYLCGFLPSHAWTGKCSPSHVQRMLILHIQTENSFKQGDYISYGSSDDQS